MYDIHCHLLPCIDDGPDNLEQALALCQQAVGNGVTHAVTTPHIHAGRWDNNKATIGHALARLQEALASSAIPLKTAAASEVRVGVEVIHLVEQEQVPYLGSWQGRRVLLVEMHHGHILPGTDNLIRWLMDHEITPMIAHPERNKDVIRNFDKITPFLEMGCLTQITAGALAGSFGEGAATRARQLLEMDAVTVMASDAHHCQRRPAQLSSGLDAAALIIGHERAHRLVYENPKAIVAGLFS